MPSHHYCELQVLVNCFADSVNYSAVFYCKGLPATEFLLTNTLCCQVKISSKLLY
jgi:hypothetical protein